MDELNLVPALCSVPSTVQSMGSEAVWGRSSRCWHLSVPACGAPAVLWPDWFRQLHRTRHCAGQALGRHVDKGNIQLLTSLKLLTASFDPSKRIWIPPSSHIPDKIPKEGALPGWSQFLGTAAPRWSGWTHRWLQWNQCCFWDSTRCWGWCSERPESVWSKHTVFTCIFPITHGKICPKHLRYEQVGRVINKSGLCRWERLGSTAQRPRMYHKNIKNNSQVSTQLVLSTSVLAHAKHTHASGLCGTSFGRGESSSFSPLHHTVSGSGISGISRGI